MRLHEYVGCDATGLAELVRKGEVTALELVELASEAHPRVNPTINGVVERYDDAESASGSDTGAFCGAPFLRKDPGPSEADRLQGHGGRLFQGFRPVVASYFVERARDELLAEEVKAYVDLAERQMLETASPHVLPKFCAQPRQFQGVSSRSSVEVIQ